LKLDFSGSFWFYTPLGIDLKLVLSGRQWILLVFQKGFYGFTGLAMMVFLDYCGFAAGFLNTSAPFGCFASARIPRSSGTPSRKANKAKARYAG